MKREKLYTEYRMWMRLRLLNVKCIGWSCCRLFANSDYAFDAVNFDTLLNEINKYFNGLFICVLFARAFCSLKWCCAFILISLDFFLFIANFVGNLLQTATTTTTTNKEKEWQTDFMYQYKQRKSEHEDENRIENKLEILFIHSHQ